MKLNGWKRIGIVASVVWIIGAYVHVSDVEYHDVIRTSALLSEDCFERAHLQSAWDLCQKQQNEYIAAASSGEWHDAAIVALAPVPVGWGFVYLVLFLVRWIKGGFL